MKNIKVLILFLVLCNSLLNATLYEDGEDGETSRWGVYDHSPQGATINNIQDGDTRVIELIGTGLENGFILGNYENESGAWGNTTQKILSWKMKTSEEFKIFIRVKTTQGDMYLYYDTNSEDSINRSPYIHNQLNSNASDGSWHTFTRDLNADVDPSGTIKVLEVNGFLVRTPHMLLDDIKLMDELDSSDTTPPVITLNGANPQIIALNSSYTEDGATAIDNVDGDISANIQIDSNVNTSVEGNYTVTYSVSDTAGNTADVVTRTVIVVLEELKKDGDVSYSTRLYLASKVFETMSNYDGKISEYLKKFI